APPLNNKYFTAGTKGEGLFLFISNLLKLVAVIAGIYFVVQLVLAGFEYISSNGDVKKTELAWAKIWQSLLGLVIISGAFIIAGVVGRLTGINILSPEIYGPTN
nr:hypothetical protein [Candidatus Shapirobacteria bacterium]